ncbi:unnamed protein product [Prorocentrum cordatum]|uniref:Uncharacterized protein n=1 Tax=Prorocentrum cordatum TaxID=2364126 RepID=A0ABN9X103_9DINO|nr:unnamed protein product [Polarella glacialis]
MSCSGACAGWSAMAAGRRPSKRLSGEMWRRVAQRWAALSRERLVQRQAEELKDVQLPAQAPAEMQRRLALVEPVLMAQLRGEEIEGDRVLERNVGCHARTVPRRGAPVGECRRVQRGRRLSGPGAPRGDSTVLDVQVLPELEAERLALGGSCCSGGQQCESLDGIGVAVHAEAMQFGGVLVGEAGSGPEVVRETCDTQASVLLGAPGAWPSDAAEVEFGGAEVLGAGDRGGAGPAPGTWHAASPFAEAKAFAAGFAAGWSCAERDAALAERVGAASQTVEESAMLVRPCGLPGGMSAIGSQVVAVDVNSDAEGVVDGGVASDDERLLFADAEAGTACSAVTQPLLGAAAAAHLKAHPAALFSRSRGLHEAGQVLQAPGAVVHDEAGAALAVGSSLKRYQEESQGIAIKMDIVGGLDVGAQLGGLANESQREDSEAPVAQQEVEEASIDDDGNRVKQGARWAVSRDQSYWTSSSGARLATASACPSAGRRLRWRRWSPEPAPPSTRCRLSCSLPPSTRQRMGVLKPAADYLAELEHGARERRLSPLGVEEIESLSLAGEAAIRGAIEAAGETGFFDEMGHAAAAEALLDAPGAPAGAADSPRQPRARAGAMGPRRRGLLRRSVAALELVHLAEWPWRPRMASVSGPRSPAEAGGARVAARLSEGAAALGHRRARRLRRMRTAARPRLVCWWRTRAVHARWEVADGGIAARVARGATTSCPAGRFFLSIGSKRKNAPAAMGVDRLIANTGGRSPPSG